MNVCPRHDFELVPNASEGCDKCEAEKAACAALPEHLRWTGEGPAPASWYAADGTKVYRSYSDYVMD